MIMTNQKQKWPTPWYVTTSIPYVNAQPHIGHALEEVQADVLARYHRLKREDVWFLTGTDENSLKNVRAAEREGIPTQALVDRNAAQFYALRNSLDLSFDDFIRTSVHTRGSIVSAASNSMPKVSWPMGCALNTWSRPSWWRSRITSFACRAIL